MRKVVFTFILLIGCVSLSNADNLKKISDLPHYTESVYNHVLPLKCTISGSVSYKGFTVTYSVTADDCEQAGRGAILAIKAAIKEILSNSYVEVKEPLRVEEAFPSVPIPTVPTP